MAPYKLLLADCWKCRETPYSSQRGLSIVYLPRDIANEAEGIAVDRVNYISGVWVPIGAPTGPAAESCNAASQETP
jgi:hypothetical protein